LRPGEHRFRAKGRQQKRRRRRSMATKRSNTAAPRRWVCSAETNVPARNERASVVCAGPKLARVQGRPEPRKLATQPGRRAPA
jgi:hypothetical protein